MLTITRFAPSPTGFLHLGHVYAAKVASELASDRHFLLRFEDIDSTRVRQPYYIAIEDDLKFLGFDWEGEAICQLDRLDAYQLALETLKQLDLVYPCFCTRKQIAQELAYLQNAPHGPEGAHYPQICKELSAEEIKEKELNQITPSWRLDVERAAQMFPDLSFVDQKYGTIQVKHDLLGDVILARKDIGTSYHLAVVVDDAFQDISLVTRGEDLLHTTHIHRILQAALDLPTPSYFHHQLICDENGKRLAKRDEATSIQSLRAQGLSRQDILGLLPSEGTWG